MIAAFFKTLFGDARTIAVVAVLPALELLLVRTGHGGAAILAVPVATLAGVTWLASR